MATLESRVQALEERAAALEGRLAGGGWGPEAPLCASPAREPLPPAVTTAPPAPQPARPPAPPPAAPAHASLSLEDVLGGRVLAWVGGVAVAIGVILMLAIAASKGWIDEGARTAIAAGVSLALLGFGGRLHERRGRTDAGLAAAAAGIVGLFATLAVAGQVYALVGSFAALVLALAVGATATALAVRWRAPGFGALGIGGALLAPVLVGAEVSDARTIALVAVASASATGVLLTQRWTWLAFGTFAISTPQWLWWLVEEQRGALAVVVVLSGFGALNLLAAAGFELRSRAPGLRRSAVFLLALNALVLGLAGYYGLQAADAPAAGRVWLAALAGIHLAAGLSGGRSRRVSHELALVCAGLGVVLADVALTTFLSGPVLVLGWAAAGTGLAAWARRRRPRAADELFAGAGTGAHLTLALAHAVALDAPPTLLGGTGTGAGEPAGLLALCAVAAGCFASGRVAEDGRREWRTWLDAAGLAVLAYTTAIALDGVALTVAWAGEAAALGAVARRARDELGGWGAVAFLGGAGAYALATLAPPTALLEGLADPAAAAAALGAWAAAALFLGARGLPAGHRVGTAPLLGAAVLALLHLASTELVTVAELGSQQRGQALLSAFWALCGVGALVTGLLRDARALRLGALGLLGVTAGKVFLYDLASLTSMYRVASFIALGLLLLCGAFAWQRLRPGGLPDLRGVPDALR